jgi:hypothetical protein
MSESRKGATGGLSASAEVITGTNAVDTFGTSPAFALGAGLQWHPQMHCAQSFPTISTVLGLGLRTENGWRLNCYRF